MDWQKFIELTKQVGYTKAVFAFFFVLAHTHIFLLYRRNLNDKQKQIDNIAEENHEYREIFMNKFTNKENQDD